MSQPDRPNPLMNDAGKSYKRILPHILQVEARQEIDLRLGAAFTRFQTLRIQNRFAVKGFRATCITYM